jgi:hypothetical protein
MFRLMRGTKDETQERIADATERAAVATEQLADGGIFDVMGVD